VARLSGTALNIGWHNFGRMRECHRRSLTKTTGHRPMILLMNKLIRLLPNPQDVVYQTGWMIRHGIDPVPLWTVNWFAELLALFQGRN
jgi:hypothetical protein